MVARTPSESSYLAWKPIEVRFWARVDKQEDGCWWWTGTIKPNGYGSVIVSKRQILAHRQAWILTYGEIPQGMIICHKCDNPSCVNPDHLFIGTSKDNTQDMLAKGRGNFWNTGKTHCRHGHKFTSENTIRYEWKGKTYRACRECANSRRRKGGR